MAITIHAPHLPHLGDWTQGRTVLTAGLATAAIAVAVVFLVQQSADDTASDSIAAETQAATAAPATSTDPIAAPTKQALAPAVSADPITAPTKQALAPAISADPIADPTKQALAPAAIDTMSLYGTDNPSFVGPASAATVGSELGVTAGPDTSDLGFSADIPDTGEYMATYGTDNP